jgi:predicted transcriptional regulator
MKTHKIHRVIIEDEKTKNFTGFITYETIFEFFVNNYYSDMIPLQIKLSEMDLLTKNIITVNKNDSIFNSLIKFWEHRISFLPIKDEENGFFGYLYLKDIVYFFANGEKFSVFFLIFSYPTQYLNSCVNCMMGLMTKDP